VSDAPATAAIRLTLLPDLLDGAGEARAALQMPTAPGRRAVVQVFATVAAALSAKRELEQLPTAEAG
jgi:hypothetical protein